MDGPRDYFTKWSQKEEDNTMWYHLHVESKIRYKWTYLETDSQIQRMDGGLPRGGLGRGMDWEFGVGRCKLLYIEWINNKVLLLSPGSYSQYPVINHNGKEYKKRMRIYKLRELVMDRETGVLQSMGLQRVGHDWTTELNWHMCVCITESLCCTAEINTTL